MSEPLYRARDAGFQYQLGTQKVRALHSIDLEIPKNEIVCLTGPSGSGKTTLLNLMGLIEPLQEGDIELCGISFRGLSESRKNDLRRFKIGFVFQSFQLFPVLSAEENVEYFLIRQGVPANERRARVQNALEAVGLWLHRSQRPGEMSGGQRQRVAVARALAKNPEVILADEPTASLDQATGKSLMQTFSSLQKDAGVSLIISSHDPMVMDFASLQVRLRDGRIDVD